MAKEYTLEEINALPEKEYTLEEIQSIPEKKSGLLKSSLETLPAAGAMFGGAAGFASPVPGGTLVGSGLGAYLGKALENVGEKYLLDEEKTRPEIYAEPVGEALSAIAGEGAGQIAGKVLGGLKTGLKSVSSSMSKIPKQVMETYAEKTPQVKEIGTDIVDAADRIRKEGLDAIESFKNIQNSKISQAVEAKKNIAVDITKTKEALENGLASRRPLIQDAEIERLKKEIDLIDNLAVDGKVSAADAFALQKRLQSLADYMPDSQILKKKDFVDTVLSRAAARSRQSLQKVAPEISEANQQISKLRRIDKNINKNLIAPEKPYEAMIGAGTGRNQKSASDLKKLEDVVNYPFLEKSQELAAAKYMNEAGILPGEMTGSSMAPFQAMGALGGGALGASIASGNYPMALGTLAAGSLASPLAIKKAIEVSGGVKNLGGYIKSKSPLGSVEMAEQLMYRAVQMGVSPYAIDGMIKNSEQLTNTMKAQLRNKNAKAVK